jgi:hypothetical protein
LGLDPSHFGFASVQLDGGIESVTRKVIHWFHAAPSDPRKGAPFSLGLAGHDIPQVVLTAYGMLAETLVQLGGQVLLAEPLSARDSKSVRYGQRASGAGIYSMETPTDDLVEALTGLPASGAQLLIAYDSRTLVPSNPLVPTLQIAGIRELPTSLSTDVDLVVEENQSPETVVKRLLQLIIQVRSGERLPKSQALQNFGFQITRGYTGISL